MFCAVFTAARRPGGQHVTSVVYIVSVFWESINSVNWAHRAER